MANSAASGRSRAFGLGSRAARLALVATAVAIVAAVILATIATSSANHAAPKRRAANAAVPASRSSRSRAPASDVRGAPGHYGYIPDWLPRPKIHVGWIVTASATHPWLAVEGDTVAVNLAHGRVLATGVGPQVPQQGHFPVPTTTFCTFTVTLTSASGSVPLNPAAFTTRDEYGQLQSLHVTNQDGGPVPRAVEPGKTVNLAMSAVLPRGQGQLQWTPSGTKPIVSWDFEVEID
jgi:hypothetical protein